MNEINAIDVATKRRTFMKDLARIARYEQGTKRAVVAAVVFDLMFTFPEMSPLFMAEGKGIEACADHVTDKMGDAWNAVPPDPDAQREIAELILEYYDISEQACGGTPA